MIWAFAVLALVFTCGTISSVAWSRRGRVELDEPSGYDAMMRDGWKFREALEPPPVPIRESSTRAAIRATGVLTTYKADTAKLAKGGHMKTVEVPLYYAGGDVDILTYEEWQADD